METRYNTRINKLVVLLTIYLYQSNAFYIRQHKHKRYHGVSSSQYQVLLHAELNDNNNNNNDVDVHVDATKNNIVGITTTTTTTTTTTNDNTENSSSSLLSSSSSSSLRGGESRISSRGSTNRRRHPITRQRDVSKTTTTTTTTPTTTIKRAPHQFDHTKADARPFIDPLVLLRNQDPNINAPVFDSFQLVSDTTTTTTTTNDRYYSCCCRRGPDIDHNNHITSMSLDDVFSLKTISFSELFASNTLFRTNLRNAIRKDIFDTTPTYSNMSDKARRMLLLPDSSIQGSWQCPTKQAESVVDDNDNVDNDNTNNKSKVRVRMTSLTQVLLDGLGPNSPTGDEFMNTIGSLCGSQPQGHWIDIVGITNRRISHSWHQDTGYSANNDTKTVLLGFPKDDNYIGCGVFTHIVKLQSERWAPIGHVSNEPVLYNDCIINDKYIIRPQFMKGQELILYRDVDVLHSAPDVAYRSSVMRFM